MATYTFILRSFNEEMSGLHGVLTESPMVKLAVSTSLSLWVRKNPPTLSRESPTQYDNYFNCWMGYLLLYCWRTTERWSCLSVCLCLSSSSCYTFKPSILLLQPLLPPPPKVIIYSKPTILSNIKRTTQLLIPRHTKVLTKDTQRFIPNVRYFRCWSLTFRQFISVLLWTKCHYSMFLWVHQPSSADHLSTNPLYSSNSTPEGWTVPDWLGHLKSFTEFTSEFVLAASGCQHSIQKISFSMSSWYCP
jgi:hypothetical protein